MLGEIRRKKGINVNIQISQGERMRSPTCSVGTYLAEASCILMSSIDCLRDWMARNLRNRGLVLLALMRGVLDIRMSVEIETNTR